MKKALTNHGQRDNINIAPLMTEQQKIKKLKKFLTRRKHFDKMNELSKRQRTLKTEQ